MARRLWLSFPVVGTLLTGCSAEIIYTGNDGFIIREPLEPINYVGVPVMSVFAVAIWVITIVCIFGGIENTRNAFRSTEKSFITALKELSSSLMIVVLMGGVSIFLTVAIRDMLTTYSLAVDGQTRVLRYQKNVFFWTRASYDYPGSSVVAIHAVRGNSNRGILQFDIIKGASRFSITTFPNTLSREQAETLASKAKKVFVLPPQTL